MAATDTANAINEVAHRLGLVSFAISAGFVAAIYLSRKAARRRLLLRVQIGVLLVVFLWFIPPFMQAGYRAIDIACMLGATTFIFGLTLRFSTFCESCNRAITNNQPWTRLRQCPHCGAQLTRPL